MANETVTVTLVLRKAIAEKLRAICHRRGERASMVVDRWIIMADEDGTIRATARPAGGSATVLSAWCRTS